MAGRETLRWLIKPKSYPQSRCVAGECDVVDGEPTPRLINYPLAGHYPELADVWPRRGNEPARLSAYRIAMILTRGQGRVVIVDESLGVRDCHRVHRD